MADEKEIAKLQFDISKAEGQLQTLDDKLKQLAFNSNISSNKNDLSKVINFDKVKKEFDSLEKIGKNRTANIANFAIKKNIEVNAKREIENAKIKSNDEKLINSLIKNEDSLATYRQKKAAEIEAANIKHANKMEEIYARQANSVKTIWSKMQNVANTYLITRGLNELRQAAVDLVKEMSDVEYKMVEIDRVLNEDSLNIDKYRDKLIQLAYDYGNSFDNVSDVTLRLAQAGFDSNESLKLTENTLLALNTAELDATQATEDMVAVMSQWGLMTGDAEKKAQDYAAIIDRINKVADNFPTTSADILEALKKTSSAFNLAGASIDETIAMIVTAEIASQRGGKAIGTAMNNIIQQMKNTNRLATMESLGIDIYTDATKSEFKSVIDIITQLSEKMQQLKRDGRENSTEMQDLLEVFTLFRRNVGAGLLSGVAGENSNYAEVLKVSMNSLGYSLQENEKHMSTAKAAMEQFNAELLKLKTAVWDNGGEDVFKSLLVLGKELIGVITDLVDIFGETSTAISIFTSSLQILADGLKLVSDGFEKIRESTKFIRDIREKLEELGFAGKVVISYIEGLKETFAATNPAMSTVIDMLDGLITKEEETEESTEELSDKLSEGIGDANALDAAAEGFSSINSILSSSIDTLNGYADQYAMLDSAVSEFNSTGEITAETLKNLADNNLLQYLDLSSDKAYINADAFNQLAIQTQNQAAEALIAAANNDMLAVAEGRLSDVSAIGQGALQGIGVQITDVGDRSSAAAMQVAEFAQQISNISGSLNVTGEIQKQVNAIGKAYTNTYKTLVGATRNATSGIKKASSGAARSAGGAAKSATKTFEEQSSERVKIFKQEIDDLESLEKAWVNKYKKLELFSTSDLKFITHQRINRFNEYLNQINNLQGITEKDRTALIKEYSAKRQEAELEYFDLLKQQLEDQISDLKKANEERIKGIEDAADAQIAALKRVEDENDKVRQKEEYERKRNELIYGNQGIEYWRQRTGRDAQLALQDAEEKLKDLDQDWEDKKKDWTLDDQIEEIEKARDAQIKAIEDAQERQIEGWKAAYNEQVRLYAETGQIIYDDSVINAGYLYNAYMDNFVNPLQFQLQNVIASLNTASAAAGEVASKVSGVSGGGGGAGTIVVSNSGNKAKSVAQSVAKATAQSTASALEVARAAQGNSAKNFSYLSSSSITPITSSVPSQSLWDKIKSGVSGVINKFIPRSHSGNEIGGTTEGLSILRPNEIVLNPEWTKGMKSFLNDYQNGRINTGNVTSIEVQGNLVNMDGVEIKDRKDVDYLKDTVIREVEKKLNVRK